MDNTPVTPCAFCGDPDYTHRMRDAVLDRWLAGETLQRLADDYGVASIDLALWIQQACMERVSRSHRQKDLE